MARPSLTRRHFLRGLGVLGLALPAVGLAACGGAAAVTATTASAAPSSATAASASAQSAKATGSTSGGAGQAAKPAATQSLAPGTVRLVYMCDIAAPYTDVAQHWADTFPQTHPGVTVEYQPVTTNYGDKLTAAYAAGSPPDVYRYLQESTPIDAAVKSDLLLDLTSYANRDKYDFSDFLPEAIGL
jgi:ABC-type glycerol-3-phosphate transport system substrate-binding protein